jgi:hypothetical protein
VAFAGSRIVVAWAQDDDVLAATVGGAVTLRRLTRSAADDRDPYAVGTGAGRAYVAWTSRTGSLRRPLLARLR